MPTRMSSTRSPAADTAAAIVVPSAYSSVGLVSDHHQINLDHSSHAKLTSDDDSSSSVSDSMSCKQTDTSISSIQEELEASDNVTRYSAPTLRPTVAIPTLSLLYSDTAPRAAWRPQLESWLKKHHPSQLREVERATSPPPILDSLQSHWSFTAVNALHSAQIHEIRCQSIHHRRTLSTDSAGDSELITRFSESAIEEDDVVVPSSSPPKKQQPHHVRKSSSHSGLRRKSYGSRDLKPYSRTPPSPTVVPMADSRPADPPRPRSNSNLSSRSILGVTPGEQQQQQQQPSQQQFAMASVPTATGVKIGKGRSPSFNQDLSSTYHPPSPPSSPSGPGAGSFSSTTAASHVAACHTSSFHSKRRCISCGSDQSPCWRPSWSASAGQLCNSCGLRYKKTNARCLTKRCGRIPAKGEWVSMKNLATRNPATALIEYKCLYCGGDVEVGEKH